MAQNDSFFGGLFENLGDAYKIFTQGQVTVLDTKNKAKEADNVTRQLQVQQFEAQTARETAAAQAANEASRNQMLYNVFAMLAGGGLAVMAGMAIASVIKAFKGRG